MAKPMPMMSPLAICLLLTSLGTLSGPTDALKVLGLFPHPAISHFRFFEPVLHELAHQGHDVTVVGLFPWKDAPENYHDIIIPGELLTSAIDLQSDWFKMRRRFGYVMEWDLSYNWGVEACTNAYNSAGVKRILSQREHFDVIIMEQFNTDCLMGVAWHLKVPVIAMSSCPLMPWHYNRFGNPHIPSYIPSLFTPSNERMTFRERVRSFVDVHLMQYWYTLYPDRFADKILREQFGDSIPPVAELAKTTSLMFVNQHYSLSGSKPLSPSVVELGGIHIGEPKPLTPDVQKFLDDAVEGVVVVSWGSMVHAKSMPLELRDSMTQAFGQLKQRVLWKWENETLPNQPANVRTTKWLQQRDVLCHPNVKVFVSHGGLMGSSEAAHCGVPSVLTPMYGDQSMNSAAFVNRGMGAIVHLEDISKDTMLAALREMLEPEALAKAKAVAYVFNNRQQTTRETAVWWVEHVARTHGSPLSKSYSVNMSMWTYYSLDVIAALLLFVLVVMTSWWWAIRRCLCPSKRPASKKMKKN